MTSRKDYKAIAEIIKNNYDVSTEPVRFMLRDMTDQIAQYFASDNPQFDRLKFVDVCGMNDGTDSQLYTETWEPDIQRLTNKEVS